VLASCDPLRRHRDEAGHHCHRRRSGTRLWRTISELRDVLRAWSLGRAKPGDRRLARAVEVVVGGEASLASVLLTQSTAPTHGSMQQQEPERLLGVKSILSASAAAGIGCRDTCMSWTTFGRWGSQSRGAAHEARTREQRVSETCVIHVRRSKVRISRCYQTSRPGRLLGLVSVDQPWPDREPDSAYGAWGTMMVAGVQRCRNGTDDTAARRLRCWDYVFRTACQY